MTSVKLTISYRVCKDHLCQLLMVFFMFSVKLGDLSAALSSFELSLDLARTQGMDNHFQVFIYSVGFIYL